MAKVVEVQELESYTTMEEEMYALAENEMWNLVDAPKGVKSIGCRWVYKVKYCHEDLHFGL